MKKIYFLLCLLIIAFSSCSKSESTSETEPQAEEKKVNLTVNNTNPPAPEPQPVTESSSPSPSPVTNRYLSGRTEFLSLSKSTLIEARGFDLGDLYFEKGGTAEEKEVASICLLFFESLKKNQFAANLVKPDRKSEMENFWDYFIRDKILIDDVILGKPQSRGKERQISLLLLPEKRKAYAYLEEIGSGDWRMTGLEVDLREEREESDEEKWAPTVSPSPYGY